MENKDKYCFITENNPHILVAKIEPAKLKNPLEKGNSKIHHMTMEDAIQTNILKRLDQLAENEHSGSSWTTHDINMLDKSLSKRPDPIMVRALNVDKNGLLYESTNSSEVPKRIAFASMQELYNNHEWDIDKVILQDNSQIGAIHDGLNYKLTYYPNDDPNGRNSSEYIRKPESNHAAAEIAYKRLQRTNYLDKKADLIPAKIARNPRGDLQFLPDKGKSLKDMQSEAYQQVLSQSEWGMNLD